MAQINAGYTRRTELRCTLAEMATYGAVVPYEGETVYVQQADGTYAVKMGDGKTPLADLPYVVNYSDIKNMKEATENAWSLAEVAQYLAETARTGAEEARDEVVKFFNGLGVAQNKGNSTTAVMSQAAVSAELDTIDSRSIRNSKRITNLEQGLPSEQFMTDSTVAHVKDVPSNALPYAEVKKIGGMTYKDGNILRSAPVSELEIVGANLFDIDSDLTTHSTKVSDTRFIGNGDVRPLANIKVTPNVKHTIKCTINDISSQMLLLAIMDGKNVSYGTASPLVAKVGTSSGNYVTATLTFTPTGDYISVTSVASVFIELMVTKADVSIEEYRPYFKRTLPIPEAVQAIEGYGESNPENAEDYNYIDFGGFFVGKGRIVDGVWVAYEQAQKIDISHLLPLDNFLEVEGGGTITAVNEYGYDAPSEITYMLKEETA